MVHALLEQQPMPGAAGSDYARLLASVTEMAPSFTLRGGTREVLRSIIARGVGLR